MIFGLLFPVWPTPLELSRMTPGGRAQWGLLMILQTLGILLGGALVLFT